MRLEVNPYLFDGPAHGKPHGFRDGREVIRVARLEPLTPAVLNKTAIPGSVDMKVDTYRAQVRYYPRGLRYYAGFDGCIEYHHVPGC